MTAVGAPKNWLSTFDGHSSLEYDTETDSSTPKTHHVSVEQNYQKKCIFEHIHIFLCMVYCEYFSCTLMTHGTQEFNSLGDNL